MGARKVVEGATRQHAEAAAAVEYGLGDAVDGAVATGRHDDAIGFNSAAHGLVGDLRQPPRMLDREQLASPPRSVASHLDGRPHLVAIPRSGGPVEDHEQGLMAVGRHGATIAGRCEGRATLAHNAPLSDSSRAACRRLRERPRAILGRGLR